MSKKPTSPVKAWENLTLIELLQLKQLTKKFPEDEQYTQQLHEYTVALAKYLATTPPKMETA